MPSGFGPDYNSSPALKMLSSHRRCPRQDELIQDVNFVQDAQEAKKGKKKKRKGKKGEDKGQEEESPAAGASAEPGSPQDSTDNASAQSAALRNESSPQTQAASRLTGERGQAMLPSAQEAHIHSDDACSVECKAAANTHSMNRGGAHGDPSMVVRNDAHAVPSSVRAPSEGDSKKGVPSPTRSQVKGAARKASQGALADCGGVQGGRVPLTGQTEPSKQSFDWQAAGGRKAKRQTAGNAGGNASSQPDTAAAHQARLSRSQPAGKGAQGEPRGTVPGEPSNPPLKAFATSVQSSARREQAGRQGNSHAGGTKGKADTGKVAKAAPAQGKQFSPSKSARQPAALPEQPGRGRKSEDSVASGALLVSFADMARPAKAPQAAPVSRPLPLEAFPAAVPTQRVRPQPRSGAVARPVQCGHAPAAAAPAHGLSPAAAASPAACMKAAAPGPWLSSAVQPSQPSPGQPSDISRAQLVSIVGLPSGLQGMPCPYLCWLGMILRLA